jgi:hypothetical protein
LCESLLPVALTLGKLPNKLHADNWVTHWRLSFPPACVLCSR